jgi:hypothetical protein
MFLLVRMKDLPLDGLSCPKSVDDRAVGAWEGVGVVEAKALFAEDFFARASEDGFHGRRDPKVAHSGIDKGQFVSHGVEQRFEIVYFGDQFPDGARSLNFHEETSPLINRWYCTGKAGVMSLLSEKGSVKACSLFSRRMKEYIIIDHH